jgi:hypothetical protein
MTISDAPLHLNLEGAYGPYAPQLGHHPWLTHVHENGSWHVEQNV